MPAISYHVFAHALMNSHSFEIVSQKETRSFELLLVLAFITATEM